MKLTDEDLKKWGQAGLFPGPLESEEAFIKRATRGDPPDSLKQEPVFFESFKHELGLSPSWISMCYSNQSLSPWEGAASWSEQSPEGEFYSLIQLRKGFKKGRFLFYKKEDVLFHETLHSLRLSFEEPRFEEIIAHHYSKNHFRRWLGPLFSTRREAYFFLASIFVSFFSPLFSALSFAPIAYLAFRSLFLIRDHRAFRRALRRLPRFFPNVSPFLIALRLRDQEIELFAHGGDKKIAEYIELQKETLRWRQIFSWL